MDSLRGSPIPAAAQLATLKQCSPKTPESAALLGHARGIERPFVKLVEPDNFFIIYFIQI